MRTYRGASRAQARNLTLDAHVAGNVVLFGREHDRRADEDA